MLSLSQLQPWNVDTISKEGFSKTLMNKQEQLRDTSTMSEEEREKHMKEFVKEHEAEMKHFGWLKHFNDSKAYLMEHTHLACEETANYLVIQCINLAMEEVRLIRKPFMQDIARNLVFRLPFRNSARWSRLPTSASPCSTSSSCPSSWTSTPGGASPRSSPGMAALL